MAFHSSHTAQLPTTKVHCPRCSMRSQHKQINRFVGTRFLYCTVRNKPFRNPSRNPPPQSHTSASHKFHISAQPQRDHFFKTSQRQQTFFPFFPLGCAGRIAKMQYLDSPILCVSSLENCAVVQGHSITGSPERPISMVRTYNEKYYGPSPCHNN